MDIFEVCSNSPNLLDSILTCINDAIVVTDTEGNILFTNMAVNRILGFTSDELMGKSLSVIFTPEDMTYLYPNLLFMAKKKESFEGEIMLTRKNDNRFFAFIKLRSYLDSEEDNYKILFLIQDIEKEKQIEKTFERIGYRDLINVASGIAHELRNPLVGIGGFANRLYKSCRAIDDHDKYYEHIIDNVKRIEDLVKKIEFFANLPEPCFTKESINSLMEKALHPYRKLMDERKINLFINIEEVSLLVDITLVLKVFSVLIENSMDAMLEPGKIIIKGEKENNGLNITVSDTGKGISNEDLPYIFNPFFSTKASGAGIGLATAKRIMAVHGGHIEALTGKTKGTAFLLRFPIERRRPIRVSLLKD
ncbi:MAG: ATP-binding protein [Thermodesulfobacteriota bacterium]|nr:ATP-binding protein [Thermodesulfobacteriota bacterium]